MTDFSKWGISPDDVGGGQPTQSVSEPDFNTKWMGADTTTTAAPPVVQPRYQTWPERLAREIGPPIASALTLAGDVSSGNTAVDPNDPNFMGRVTGLAGLVGTGAMPSVTGPTKALIDPAAAKLASLARDQFGIPLRGGQISESPTMNYLDSVMKTKPFSGMAANDAAQHSAFNRAVAGTLGEDAEKVTPEVMANAKQRLGQNYEDIAAQTTLKFDQPLNAQLGKIVGDAQSVLQPSEHSIITKQVQGIIDKVEGGGTINGETFQSLIRTGSPLDRATKSGDTNVKYYAGQIKSALIDAMGRSAPEDMQTLLKQTNSQYKSMKTIEDLVEKSPTGDISPALLMGAVRKSYGNMAYGGGGNLADLARIGQRFLKEPPQSGTQPRLSISNMLGLGGLGVGEGAALYFHDPVMGAKIAALAGIGMAGKAAVNRGVGSFLKSDAYANRLINSSLPGAGSTSSLQKLLQSNTPYLPPAGVAMPMLPLMQQAQ